MYMKIFKYYEMSLKVVQSSARRIAICCSKPNSKMYSFTYSTLINGKVALNLKLPFYVFR